MRILSGGLAGRWLQVAGLAMVAVGCTQGGGSSSSSSGSALAAGEFPAGFLWGTAVAGFQVEAGCPTVPAAECEDRNSDWYQFVMSPEARMDDGAHLSGQDVSAGPGFYELYASDIGRMKTDLKVGAFRMGLEWSRIFPTATFGITGFDALKAAANPQALAFYHAVLAELRTQGITPLVTLNHYSIPLWLHDGMACHRNLNTCTERGWLDARMVDELAKFSGFAAQEFGGEVDLWATQNEPMAVVLAGYVFPTPTRTNPPWVNFQLAAGRQVMATMQVAHARQYDAVKAADTVDADGDGQASRVGLVQNLAAVLPRNPESVADQAAAEGANYLYNVAFLEGTIRGKYDPDLDGVPEDRPDMAGRMDYLGVNYYTRIIVEGTSDGLPALPELSPLTTFNPLTLDQGPIYPRGIYDVVKLAQGYGLPIIITENGAEDPMDNGTGSRFVVEHLTHLQRAIAEGANVQGYFWWTLTDNLEWNHGMDIRMGLYAVDKDDPMKARVARRTVGVYARIVEANRIPADLMATYPVP